jgi:hypothetical protein
VPAAEWVSQFDAADTLGVSVLRIGGLIANDHLDPAENPEGVAGVTKNSLKREMVWRRNATPWDRLKRAAAFVGRWI